MFSGLPLPDLRTNSRCQLFANAAIAVSRVAASACGPRASRRQASKAMVGLPARQRPHDAADSKCALTRGAADAGAIREGVHKAQQARCR